MIVSLNVGKPRSMLYEGNEVYTGIDKKPIAGRVMLRSTNLDGDEQADCVNHGGVDKAVCVYSAVRYTYWEQELHRPFAWAAFGENVTVAGFVEEDVCVGDRFQLGEAVVEISQPRGPCYKVAKKHSVPDLPLRMQMNGYTGYYFRVIREGFVQAGDVVSRIEAHPCSVTIMEVNRVAYQKEGGVAGLRRVLACDKLSLAWKGLLQKRLNSEGQEG